MSRECTLGRVVRAVLETLAEVGEAGAVEAVVILVLESVGVSRAVWRVVRDGLVASGLVVSRDGLLWITDRGREVLERCGFDRCSP